MAFLFKHFIFDFQQNSNNHHELTGLVVKATLASLNQYDQITDMCQLAQLLCLLSHRKGSDTVKKGKLKFKEGLLCIISNKTL